jgi:hypothetical protein
MADNSIPALKIFESGLLGRFPATEGLDGPRPLRVGSAGKAGDVEGDRLDLTQFFWRVLEQSGNTLPSPGVPGNKFPPSYGAPFTGAGECFPSAPPAVS